MHYALYGEGIGMVNDQSISGYLHLFDPSNDTVFVKHFILIFNMLFK